MYANNFFVLCIYACERFFNKILLLLLKNKDTKDGTSTTYKVLKSVSRHISST